ncbi:MAG: OstA-like protein [Ekhidna sp.]
MRNLLHYFILITALVASIQVAAQTKGKGKIKYKADDLFEFRKDGEKVRRLEGNVVFAQETSTMYCDSSYYYVKENIMEAFGHVKIVDDSVTITSDKLIYNGTDRTSKLRDNVVYTKGEQKLVTNFLDYNMDTEVGNYYNKGTLSDTTNTLSSETGYFYSKENYALFWKNVVLIAPDYTLKSDTLRYNTNTKIAITEGRTEIFTENDQVLHAKGGEFKTRFDQSEFIDGNIETIDYYMEGDELFFDELRKYYLANGNVELVAKNDDVIITGDEGFHDKNNEISKVYGNAIMKRIMQFDTLYMSADTLVSIESQYDSAKRILAYPNVKIWKRNLQGVADSVSYFLSDSLMFFYNSPVFWNNKSQITGDTIVMSIKNEEIETMTLLQSAFLISEDTIHNFNQVSGRTMKAYFSETKIQEIDVNGNGESIYYVLDEDKPGAPDLMGMNRILCSDMTIRFVEEELDNISFYIKPSARFIPPHELTPDVQRLGGFNWRIEERPELKDLIGPQGFMLKIDNKTLPPALPDDQEIDLEGIKPNNNRLLKKPKGGG